MPNSQNGYSANDRSVIATYTVPGTTLKIPLRKGDVSVVLLEYLRRYHLEVESLYNQPQDLWGYAARTIRGSSTTLSNHASGTAVDARAVKNGLGMRGTFTAAQERALDRLLSYFEGVLRHGRGWSRPDPMHAEINSGAAAVKRIADKIRSGVDPSTPSGGGVPDRVLELTTPFMRGDDVLAVQVAVGVPVAERDGMYGPDTERRVRAFQQSRGLTVDGQVGPQTRAAIRSATAPSSPPPPPAPAAPGAAVTAPIQWWSYPVPDYYTGNAEDRLWASECLAWGTTHAAHARDAAREALAKATTLESKVDALMTRLVSGGTSTAGPVALTDADVARIAAAVLDELSKRTAT